MWRTGTAGHEGVGDELPVAGTARVGAKGGVANRMNTGQITTITVGMRGARMVVGMRSA
jgi:hypothetical protein